jgi:peptidoglycan/LPS O-acetylase OafA/YrhL
MSTFPKNILLCLFLVPNIVFARGGESFIIPISIGLLLTSLFMMSFYFANKNGWAWRISISILLYILMILFWWMIYPINEKSDILIFVILALLPVILSYFFSQAAHKIIK